jgi:hypothetical protein
MEPPLNPPGNKALQEKNLLVFRIVFDTSIAQSSPSTSLENNSVNVLKLWETKVTNTVFCKQFLLSTLLSTSPVQENPSLSNSLERFFLEEKKI